MLHVLLSLHSEQLELHDKHEPSLKYLPWTQPGTQVVSFKMNPSKHDEHYDTNPPEHLPQAELHLVQL